MSFFNPNNALEESSLLFFLTGLLGLRVVGPRHRRWLSYFHAIIATILFVILFFITREWMWRHYDKFEDVMYYYKGQRIQSYLNLVFIPVIMFSAMSESFDEIIAYKKLDEVDRGLSFLNSPIDHEIQMRKEVVCLSIYVLVTLLMTFVTHACLATEDTGYIFNISSFVNHMPVFLGVMILCSFDIFVRKILLRFEHVNAVIANLLGPRKISVIHVQSTDINNASKLQLARRIHLQLHDAASAINKAYGSRLFVVFFATLISVLNHFREALNLLGNNLAALDIFLHLLWISFHTMKYFHLANSCRYATIEAKLTSGYFFESLRGPEGLNEEVKVFSQQLVNRQLEVNAWSILAVNVPKGLMICIAIVSYFLLLAQIAPGT